MRLRCSSFLHTPRRAWKGMHMRNYTTQMEAARKQIVTKELEIVAQKTYDDRRADAAGGRRKGCHLCQQKSHLY